MVPSSWFLLPVLTWIGASRFRELPLETADYGLEL
jgi:hypothetical protein